MGGTRNTIDIPSIKALSVNFSKFHTQLHRKLAFSPGRLFTLSLLERPIQNSIQASIAAIIILRKLITADRFKLMKIINLYIVRLKYRTQGMPSLLSSEIGEKTTLVKGLALVI